MFSLVSSQKISITSRESTPKPRNTRASSLANDTLVAWKALQAYFSDSAVVVATCRVSTSRNENSSATVAAALSSAVPTTTNGGAKKSRTLTPSRRNSGHIAVPTSQPGTGSANTGATTWSTVPGGTVLRTTTAWNPLAGGDTWVIA